MEDEVIPHNPNPLLMRHCYKLDFSGGMQFEAKVASTYFFTHSGLSHTVVPQETLAKEILSVWSKEAAEINAVTLCCFYQLRLVSWMQKAWFILSLNHNALYSLAVVAEEHGYMLSDREFSTTKEDGYLELFPFFSPSFRTLRPQLLLLEM